MQKYIATRIAKRKRELSNSDTESDTESLVNNIVVQSDKSDKVNDKIVINSDAVYVSLFKTITGKILTHTTPISDIEKVKESLNCYTDDIYIDLDFKYATCNSNLKRIKLDDVNMIENIKHNKTLVVYPNIHEDLLIMCSRFNPINKKYLLPPSFFMNSYSFKIPDMYIKNYYYIANILICYNNYLRTRCVTEIKLYYFVFVNIIKQYMYVGMSDNILTTLMYDDEKHYTDYDFAIILSLLEYYKLLHNIIIITGTYDERTCGVHSLIENIISYNATLNKKFINIIKHEYNARIVRAIL